MPKESECWKLDSSPSLLVDISTKTSPMRNEFVLIIKSLIQRFDENPESRNGCIALHESAHSVFQFSLQCRDWDFSITEADCNLIFAFVYTNYIDYLLRLAVGFDSAAEASLDVRQAHSLYQKVQTFTHAERHATGGEFFCIGDAALSGNEELALRLLDVHYERFEERVASAAERTLLAPQYVPPRDQIRPTRAQLRKARDKRLKTARKYSGELIGKLSLHANRKGQFLQKLDFHLRIQRYIRWALSKEHGFYFGAFRKLWLASDSAFHSNFYRTHRELTRRRLPKFDHAVVEEFGAQATVSDVHSSLRELRSLRNAVAEESVIGLRAAAETHILGNFRRWKRRAG